MAIETPLSPYHCSGGSLGFEMYAVSDNGNTETYMMPGTELNPRLPSPVIENFQMMASDGSAADFVVDPSLYYPAAPTYGYYCTGFESPSEWDDHHAVFGVDGADIQYAGAQSENLPYVYYTPSYGMGDTPFNPYNPYIPGAMVGVDGQLLGTQPYYAVSPYPNSASSSGYFPVLVQSGHDAASSATDTMLNVAPSTMNRSNGSTVKRTHSSSPAAFSMNSSKAASSQTHALTGASQGSKISTGTSKRPMSNRSGGSIGSVHGASSHVPQGGNAPESLQSARNISYGKLLSQANQVKYSYPMGGGLSDYGASTNGQAVLNDWSKYYYRRPNDSNGNLDQLGEQNRGPRTNKSKNQLIVKAYTTRAGDRNAEGNIVISADQYNKDDFSVDYANAKFFVIKSYSEDDVHKSIKYNVWSSTPNGNKKLSIAYEDALNLANGKPRGCPVFLFFSVNASGQFCGVAEMIGPVDFDKDMDFWQQDKWSGSFPVKWHIIKDVPNPTFRHIILENNEHKPVTNSRDTQEIMHRQGVEMLKLFKNYTSKTSLLDDFMYYENRQKIMHEERTRIFRRANGHVHPIETPLKHNSAMDHSQKVDEVGTWVEKGVQPSNSSGLKTLIKSEVSSGDGVHVPAASTGRDPSEVPTGNVSTLKFGSLCIHPKPSERQSAAPATSSAAAAAPAPAPPPAVSKSSNAASNVVTVGSMPIKVDGANVSTETLTIGTIALDPKALQHGKVGSVKGAVRK
ncbi:YTH domain-containing family protein 1-like isoform X1 [Chenopodium quinoa]|uniref:YTH domain-containing family protein 1-like isoform X1 n=2 Tax=Chenopodium quinoa TaxID=63459 RepID=UPI000B791EA7|nr:YTH domain-containing family protein 1-like isoform X1 [Chenopodium quinoa]